MSNSPVHYLGLTQVAQHIGVTEGTMRGYSSRGYLPQPDAYIGEGIRAVRGWLPQTIDEWNKNRPGQGKRTKQTSTS
ncbi:transcriptional regulator [Actinotignum urinale]|uniref:helix-turn-helix transcriptional regulator n=1 Tax=Actinotignum urinale TaxID=190146 RepID=UPI0003B6F619|nr:transcriptional regulator [Actinotignum urinale]MDY5151376.1 transcriptional regulator [Actinotignum urinale]MDY5159538.1 transcriptional regulator [Actinotignum urinale]